jgi:XPG N-terminal domain
MGIQGLIELITGVAPCTIKETKIKNYSGRSIAIDASKLKNSRQKINKQKVMTCFPMFFKALVSINF